MNQHKRPTNIVGYIHPEKMVYENGNTYKTFTEGESNFGKINLTDTTYLKQSLEDYKEFCPICDTEPIKIHNNVHNQKECKNLHSWYTNRDGSIKVGIPP